MKCCIKDRIYLGTLKYVKVNCYLLKFKRAFTEVKKILNGGSCNAEPPLFYQKSKS